MAYQDVDKVFRAHIGNPTAKHVLLLLAWHKNKDTGLCCPSLETLAKESELSKNTIRSAIDFLVANRFVSRIQHTSKNGRVTKTEYVLLQAALVSTPDISTADISTADISTADTTLYQPLIHDVSATDTTLYQPLIHNKEIEQVNEQESNNKESSLSRLDETLPLFDGQPQAQKDEPKQAKKTRTKKPNTLAEKPDDVDEQVWNDFLTVRKAKRAPVTPTAVEGIQREAQKAGISLNDAIKLIVTRGWQAFNNGYSWKTNSQSQRQANRPLSRERMALHDDF